MTYNMIDPWLKIMIAFGDDQDLSSLYDILPYKNNFWIVEKISDTKYSHIIGSWC